MSTVLFYNIVKAVLESYVDDEPERYEYHHDVVESLKEPCLGINGILGEMESGGFNAEVDEKTGDFTAHVICDELIARGDMKSALIRATTHAKCLSIYNTGEDQIDIGFTYEGALTVNE